MSATLQNLLPSQRETREVVRIEAILRQRLAHLSLDLPTSFDGPQPFCRECQRGVDGWAWDHYADGFWGVTARCHGDTCGGLVPWQHHRIEAFCDEPPHMVGTRIWMVTIGGGELQASPQRIQTMMDSYPVLTGPFGEWCQRNAKYIGSAAFIGSSIAGAIGFWR